MLIDAVGKPRWRLCLWGSYSPVVATISAPGERERWFGFLGALRNASFAIGGLVAALAYTAVVVNAGSYLLAFSLLLSAASPHREHEQTPDTGSAPGWGRVLRDRPNLLLVATNFTYATSAMPLNIAMPVYIVESLGLPGWVVDAVFTINTVMIGLGQGLVVNAMAGSVRTNIVALGSLLSAASYVVLLSADWTTVGVGVAIVVAGAVVYTGGELVAGPVLTALSTDAAPAHLRGRYVSLFQTSWNVSSTVAPLALTWLLEQGWTSSNGLPVFRALSVAGVTRAYLSITLATIPQLQLGEDVRDVVADRDRGDEEPAMVGSSSSCRSRRSRDQFSSRGGDQLLSAGQNR